MSNIDQSRDCIHCGLCTAKCSLLSKYGVDIGQTESLRTLAHKCFLCGECSRVCPEGIDGRAIMLELREAICDEDLGVVKQKYSGAYGEKADYKFRNYKRATNGTVYFPGCNFPSLYPRTSEYISKVLKDKFGIGTVYDCCGKPIGDLGDKEGAKAINSKMESLIEEYGITEFVTACPNCKDAKAYREGTDAYLCMTLGSTDLISDAAVFDIMYNYITTKELKADASNYVVVDVRKLADFEASHIRGSVSADVDAAVAASDNTNATAIANIKKLVDANEADTKYVLVCYSGNKYARAATTIMAELGVDPANILTLKGGFAQWTKDYPTDVVFEYQYVNADDVFAALTDKDVVILDSRKAADYKTAHIPGAVNADCDSIVSNNEEEPATTNIANVVTKYGTDKTYFVVCYSGNRYAKAATDILESKGVNKDKIYTLGGDDRAVSSNGGMKAWNAKYPNYVVKTYTSTGGFNFMNGITAANLKVDVEGKKVFTVVDLRTADLYKAGHIPGAVSAVQRDVTADEAKANLQTMLTKNPNGKYVLVCYTGNKFADQARNILVNELGVDEKDVIILEGGQNAWTGQTVATE
ncbi:MAG: rhodanese-like domain-containing protein [Firmicutes bacterium]|nr:rhodanese-like domain-containing protein [Bacillota bacterium]